MRFDRRQARHLPRSHGHGEKSLLQPIPHLVSSFLALCISWVKMDMRMTSAATAQSELFILLHDHGATEYNGTQRSQVGRGADLTAVKHKAYNV